MVVKGLVSAINSETNLIDVILPEYDNIVIKDVRLYREDVIEKLKVNDFVLVAVFNDNFADCMVL